MKKSFTYIRGGLNTGNENGTYCCIKLINNVIGYSSIKSAFGAETELSAINSAINNLKDIINELEESKQSKK
jgi:hypothetical protein